MTIPFRPDIARLLSQNILDLITPASRDVSRVGKEKGQSAEPATIGRATGTGKPVSKLAELIVGMPGPLQDLLLGTASITGDVFNPEGMSEARENVPGMGGIPGTALRYGIVGTPGAVIGKDVIGKGLKLASKTPKLAKGLTPLEELVKNPPIFTSANQADFPRPMGVIDNTPILTPKTPDDIPPLEDLQKLFTPKAQTITEVNPNAPKTMDLLEMIKREVGADPGIGMSKAERMAISDEASEGLLLPYDALPEPEQEVMKLFGKHKGVENLPPEFGRLMAKSGENLEASMSPEHLSEFQKLIEQSNPPGNYGNLPIEQRLKLMLGGSDINPTSFFSTKPHPFYMDPAAANLPIGKMPDWMVAPTAKIGPSPYGPSLDFDPKILPPYDEIVELFKKLGRMK